MKKEKISTIEVKGPDISPCAYEGCQDIAVAFLQKAKETPDGKRKVISSIGYCTEHARKIHAEMADTNYQPKSFDTPHKL